MGKASVKENKSVYQLAREEMGYTRAEASDRMNNSLSENRIFRIENGTANAQPYDVCEMSICYKKPELRNYYCTNECHIGRMDAPKVEFKSNIHEILVNMVVSLEHANSKKSRLMEILADGQISDDELADFEDIQDELEHISTTVEALQIWVEKMKSMSK